MNKFYLMSIAVLTAIFPGNAFAEEMTISTYYPAPFGVYREFTTTYNTYLARDGGSVGIGTTDPGAKLEVDGGFIRGEFDCRTVENMGPAPEYVSIAQCDNDEFLLTVMR